MIRRAKTDGICAACQKPYLKREYVDYREAVHMECMGLTDVPAAPTPEQTRLAAMDALEEAVLTQARAVGVSDEVEKKWERYQKVKEYALRPGTPAEGQVAWRRALLEMTELIKIAF